MYYSEAEAGKAVVEAGIRLCETGLAERTWGNISARINDEYFLITPSGRSYDSLTETYLVRVKISDLSYDISAVPSSEKGVHAAIYEVRPEVGFIIHTHQNFATVCGIDGKDLSTKGNSILGDCVPCANYALPSTQELMDNVREAVERIDGCRAALMKHHGAVCFGAECEDCFVAAFELERICSDIAASIPVTLQLAPQLGFSTRESDSFVWNIGNETAKYSMCNECGDSLAELHRAIYASSDAQCIVHASSSAAVNISAQRNILPAYVDDFAMIAGEDVLCAQNADEIADSLRGRSAVLIKGKGALCFGKDMEDARATAAILEKNCLAALYAKGIDGCEPISSRHARHLRDLYLNSYSKRKDA